MTKTNDSDGNTLTDAQGGLGGWSSFSGPNKLGLPHPSRVLCGRVGLHERLHHLGAFPSLRRPRTLDLDRPLGSRRPGQETAPFPLLRTRHQSTMHRIPVDIPQLLYPLLLTPHREIIIPNLPEAPEFSGPQPS